MDNDKIAGELVRIAETLVASTPKSASIDRGFVRELLKGVKISTSGSYRVELAIEGAYGWNERDLAKTITRTLNKTLGQAGFDMQVKDVRVKL